MLSLKPTPEELAGLDTENSYLVPFVNEDVGIDVELVLSSPNRAQYRRFIASSMDEKKRLSAVENLVMECVLWPERQRLEQALDARPGLVMAISEKLMELAGIFEEVRVKKL